MVQNYITNYWQNKEKLPTSLRDLEDPLLGTVVPVDPETGEPYEYRVVSNLTFELCATFTTKGEDDQRAVPMIYPPRGQDYGWQHDLGRTCFERTIDPDFFQLTKPRPL